MSRYLQQAVRSLCRSPGFFSVAVLMLGLGIGMSTAAFSTASAILLRSMPFPDSDRMVRIFRTSQASNREAHSPANFVSVRSAAKSFSAVAAYWEDQKNISWPGQAPEKRWGLGVSTDFFATLGIQPQIGRDFAAGEDLPDRNDVVLLSNAFWKERFSADPRAVGRTIRVGVDKVTVVGILPASFDTTPMWGGASYVRPLTIWAAVRKGKWFNIVAKLKPGVSRNDAQAELAGLASEIDRQFPEENRLDGFSVVGLASSDIDDASKQLYWLAVALAVLVLVIACANLAGVQLARALGHSHEFAVRTALGASRFNLMAPLLAECLVLSLLGGGLGIYLAHWANAAISRSLWQATAGIPIDAKVVAFAFGVSVLTGLAFGLAPAWLASGVSTDAALKENSRGGTPGRGRNRFKGALVVFQLASALILVSAALSFGLGVKAALKRDFGWRPDGLYYGFLDLQIPAYSPEPARLAFFRQLRDQLRAIPGVTDVALCTEAPLLAFFGQHDDNIVIEGFPPPAAGHEPTSQTVGVDPSFFADAKIPLKAGRIFPASVGVNDLGMVVINESMARKFWPGESAVGKRIRYTDSQKWNEVVGVVGDIRQPTNFQSPPALIQIYRPLEQRSSQHLSFLLKTALDPDSLNEVVRKTVAGVNPDLMVDSPGSLERILTRFLSESDLSIEALGCFAVVGLFISLIGLYAVMSQMTLQRKREIGIRIALGATSRKIVQLIVKQGVLYMGIGVALGLLGAAGVDGLYRHSMPELQLPGFAVQVEVVLLLCAAGVLACFFPARQAAQTDPMIALRSE
jgi:putative ABC transport system permease protein